MARLHSSLKAVTDGLSQSISASLNMIAYVLDGHRLDIHPAAVERDWMEASSHRFAYRCLPLNIANSHGWEILCNSGFSAIWSGRADLEAIAIEPDPGEVAPVVSHFGGGVLTFHIPCLFRTESGYDLMVQGPVNRPKDGIAPLTGIVEADWSPYSFTMNWIFTRPGLKVTFEKGEPYCHFFPVRRGALEAIRPELRLLSDNPDLKREHESWSASRKVFTADLGRSGSAAQSARWQKHYHRGLCPDGQRIVKDHRTRLKLKPFVGPK